MRWGASLQLSGRRQFGEVLAALHLLSGVGSGSSHT